MSKLTRVILLTMTFILLLPLGNAQADNSSLKSVHSEAIVNIDGTVDIEQTWIYNDTETASSTEHYVNLNMSYANESSEVKSNMETISDYVVYHNGEKMEFNESWNINDSFEKKSGKYGVLVLSDNEVELTFGMTDRDINEYKVKYKAHNIIKETTDGYKYLHWTFLPTDLSPSPLKLTAEIHAPNGLEIEKIYGFQFDGTVGFLGNDNSKMFAEMKGLYRKDNTLNVFALFSDDSNSLRNTVQTDQTIDEKAIEMLDGSDYSIKQFHEGTIGVVETPKNSFVRNVFNSFSVFSLLGNIPFLVFIFIIITFFIRNSPSTLTKSMSKEDVIKLKRDKDFYYRDEPDEISNATPLIKSMMNPGRMMDNNIISYFISKWISDEVFEYLGKEERKVLFFKPEKVTVFQVNESKLNADSQLEKDLFNEFYSISNVRNVITTGDLHSLSISEITNAIKRHNKSALLNLKEKGYTESIQSLEKPSMFIKKDKPVLTEKGVELIFQHAGMKNFLTQFTLIEERKSSEVILWDYYFHMAALYGIADEFKKELREMPDLSEQDVRRYNNHYGNTPTSLLSREIGNAVNSAYSSHNSHSFSSSSSGGGGGSSGGGSGGGTR